MKLILLPGMDGTGELFEDFLKYYDGDYLVLQLSKEDEQSYECLAEKVRNELPKSDFILLVESFSGGLVKYLVNVSSLRGVIFVASFITAPNRALLHVARIAPKKLLTYIPGNMAICRFLFLGSDSTDCEYRKFITIVRSIRSACLNGRITAMLELDYFNDLRIDLPCVYIRPNQDRIVDDQKFTEISKVFVSAECYRLDGPHFILQTKPDQGAKVIMRAVNHIKNDLRN